MFKKFFSKLLGTSRVASRGRHVGRARTKDDAFKFRMGAGFIGDINRAHPFSAEPCLIDVNAPPTAYGQPVVVDAATQGVRPLVAGDSGLDAIYGITVRPYPTQAATAGAFGGTQTAGGAVTPGGAPPASGVLDVLRNGYIMVKANVGSAPVKGGRVFIWVAATAGNHIQGQFESAAGGGANTIELDEKSFFNGAPDANGIVELSFNL